MTIYTDSRKPYFYIIQHKDGMKYAGAKWGRDANPDLFMMECSKGYTTSSSYVKTSLTDQSGVIYSILDIILEEDIQMPSGCLTIKDYEDWFLVENDCISSDAWINKMPPHMAPYGSLEFEKNMILKYGTKTALHDPETFNKFITTNNKRYGGNSPMCSANVRETHKKSIQSHYGEQYSNPAQVPEVKKSTRESNIIKFGGPAPICDERVKEKILNTIQREHGVQYTNAAQLPSSKENQLNTNMIRYGVSCAANSIENKKNTLQNLQREHGVQYTNFSQLPSIKEKTKNTNLIKYGVTNQNKIPFFCTECNKKGFGLSAIGRYHKNHTGVFLSLFGSSVDM